MKRGGLILQRSQAHTRHGRTAGQDLSICLVLVW